MNMEARIHISWPSVDIDVDLRVDTGRTIAIMGPNGAGKSTILRCLAGLLAVHSGTISMAGTVWDDPGRRVFVPPRERNVGVVFQDHLLFAHLDALNNVAFGPRARGVSVREARTRALDCLQRTNLADLATTYPAQLSGGQSQRVALARALVNRPSLLLLDEPLAALDVVTRRQMRSEISRVLADYQTTTLIVTHDPDDARQVADEVVIVENGGIVQRGTVHELTTHPASAYVAELFAPS